MSRRMPIPRPARPMLRRGRERVQLGLDPERSVVVERLSDIASTALVRLDGRIGRHEVLRFAPELADVVDELDRRLVDTPGTAQPLSIDAILELRAPDAVVSVLPVARHPVCGCGWAGGTRTMVG